LYYIEAAPIATEMDTGFARALLIFYDRHRRDLPWRGAPDPYRTLVSELMLQQTVVRTVVPYFQRFTARWPTLVDLARAEEDEVLALWSGLGYYSRARNLHRTARLVLSEHGGRLPVEEAVLARLPGLGPYTAAAVAAIGFGARTLPVDGNAARVLARLFSVSEPIDRPAVRAQLRTQGLALVPEQRCGDFAQAMMELGALVCTPAAPRCGDCPVVRWCAAFRSGQQQALPVRSERAAKRKVRVICTAVERSGRVLLVRRPPGTLLGGTWTLPAEELARATDACAAVGRALAGIGLHPDGPFEELGSIRHVFTHRDVTALVVRQRARGRLRSPARWVDGTEELAISSFTRKTLHLLTRG
jgi:A/G-specific adenine glycosylase